jgi:hypothetical protein
VPGSGLHLEGRCTSSVAWPALRGWLHAESGMSARRGVAVRREWRGRHVEGGWPWCVYIGAHLLELIFTFVGVFKYFRVAIGTCSSLPVMSALVLSFQVAPSEKVTRRFMLHR